MTDATTESLKTIASNLHNYAGIELTPDQIWADLYLQCGCDDAVFEDRVCVLANCGGEFAGWVKELSEQIESLRAVESKRYSKWSTSARIGTGLIGLTGTLGSLLSESWTGYFAAVAIAAWGALIVDEIINRRWGQA